MDRSELIDAFRRVREQSETLCEPLETEDFVIQTIDDVSPPKWHLGHTAWFFERVVLQQFQPDYRPIDDRYYYIFNSYYESFGERVLRNLRGTISRPTVPEVLDYRRRVTERMVELINSVSESQYSKFEQLVVLGMNHEQQHQELFVTDIKHIFSQNPLYPVYMQREVVPENSSRPAIKFIPFEGGVFEIGANGNGFAYDNEYPRHKTLLNDFSLSNRLVTCGEYLEFIKDKGYENHHLWLSDAWAVIEDENWRHPLYWQPTDNGWQIMTLSGLRPLDLQEPVCHVSFYEAAAYARWADKRLPTEAEWEVASQKAQHIPGNLLDDSTFHPTAKNGDPNLKNDTIQSLVGDVWEWTNSAYLPYPGYRQTKDALGEYNGKFMSNQMVLRGGSCATPRDHIRTSYRNFFQPEKRWQFTGIRLAE